MVELVRCDICDKLMDDKKFALTVWDHDMSDACNPVLGKDLCKGCGNKVMKYIRGLE